MKLENRIISPVGRVFANDPRDLGSIPGQVLPNTLKMVLDNSLLNTQQYKVRIKGKVEQLTEISIAPLNLGVVAIEKGAFWLPLTTCYQFYFTFIRSKEKGASCAEIGECNYNLPVLLIVYTYLPHKI